MQEPPLIQGPPSGPGGSWIQSPANGPGYRS